MQYDLMDVGKSYNMLGGKLTECHFEGVRICGRIILWRICLMQKLLSHGNLETRTQTIELQIFIARC
jgi:hypothetical protein